MSRCNLRLDVHKADGWASFELADLNSGHGRLGRRVCGEPRGWDGAEETLRLFCKCRAVLPRCVMEPVRQDRMRVCCCVAQSTHRCMSSVFDTLTQIPRSHIKGFSRSIILVEPIMAPLALEQVRC
jgi:hypothetical protein